MAASSSSSFAASSFSSSSEAGLSEAGSSTWESDEPAPINVESPAFGLAFHPKRDLLAVGLVSGQVELWEYACEKTNTLAWGSTHHGQSCRAVSFSADGRLLVTASADQSIGVLDVSSGKLLTRMAGAHDYGLSALTVEMGLVVTGDDDGVIKGWDIRQKMKPCWQFDDCQSDFITDLLVVRSHNTLLATSGDGTLGAYSTRRGKLISLSDDSGDDEPLSLALAHGGRFVATGMQDGTIKLWKWDQWAMPTSSFAGHPTSVDCILPIDEKYYATGSSDGLIRLVSLLPNQLIGVVGHHQTFPIEELALCREKKYLASASHDLTIHFWNIANIEDDDDDDDDDDDGDDDDDDDSDKDSDDDSKTTAAVASSSSRPAAPKVQGAPRRLPVVKRPKNNFYEGL